MIDFGTVRPGSTLYIPFATYDSNDPSASVTLTGLAVTDIEVYRDGSTTQRASDAGYVLLDTDGVDFDAITGIHGFSIDLADNTAADFWKSGSQYWVVVSSVTVDGATINFIAATFRIGYPGAVLDTYIATLASQTSFALNEGPAEDDALNGRMIILHDAASKVQVAHAVVLDYVGSTKSVTLAAAPSFAIAAGDNVAVMGLAPLQPSTPGRALAVETDGMAHADLKEWLGVGPGALVSGRVDAHVGAKLATLPLSTQEKADVNAEVDAALDTAVPATPTAGSINERVKTMDDADLPGKIGTPANLGGGATLAANLADIESQTDDIGVAGAGLTSIPDSAGVTTLLSRITSSLFSGITSLAQWLGLLAGKQVGDATARAELRATGSGSGTYDETTDSQEAIRDTPPMGTPMRGTDNAALAADYTAARAAKLDNLDAAVSSRSAPATAQTIDMGQALPATPAADTTGRALKRADAQTGDSFARLGAPAGASVSADVAAAKTAIDAIRAITDAIGATAAANLAKSLGAAGLPSGAAVAGTLSTTQMSTDLTEATNDHYKGRVIIWITGALAGQATEITAYDGTAKVLTYAATTEAPATGDQFIIV